ncbi:hypothetical protein DFH07DRAFT_803148 [Mycena maculata]|uniref:Uncharacterized protein n=1 Tax=Mycena maculata TaxID=230809 RepID=A0AAD7JTY4_9AGAR|nr:hypothetical protein DFH07DRAFT_803148 [Mycena maculata]
MSTNRNKTEDGRRKNGDTVTFNVDTTGWSSADRTRVAEYQANFNQPFPPKQYNVLAPPNGPFEVRMGRFPPVPDSARTHTPSNCLSRKTFSAFNSSPTGRHHKSDSRSATPGPYNGSPGVNRLPPHTTSQRVGDFPHELGGRNRQLPLKFRPSIPTNEGDLDAYPQAPPPLPPQRPKESPGPRSSYQTASYPSSMMPTPGVPRSPDGLTGQRISRAMSPLPGPQPGRPQQASRPGNHPDPRYPSNGRGY